LSLCGKSHHANEAGRARPRQDTGAPSLGFLVSFPPASIKSHHGFLSKEGGANHEDTVKTDATPSGLLLERTKAGWGGGGVPRWPQQGLASG
jgi:hypothetical protein